MDDSLTVNNLASLASNALGLIFSPSAGVMLFMAPAVVMIVWDLLHRTARPRTTGDRVSALLIAFALAAQWATLSVFFAPFGWVAWNSRLMVPVVVTAGVVVGLTQVGLAHGLIHSLAVRVAPRWLGLALVLIPLTASVGYLAAPQSTDAFWGPTESCPVTPVIQLDKNYYFHCLTALTWSPRSQPFEVFRYWVSGDPDLPAAVFAIASVAGLATWLVLVTAQRHPSNDAAQHLQE